MVASLTRPPNWTGGVTGVLQQGRGSQDHGHGIGDVPALQGRRGPVRSLGHEQARTAGVIEADQQRLAPRQGPVEGED